MPKSTNIPLDTVNVASLVWRMLKLRVVGCSGLLVQDDGIGNNGITNQGPPLVRYYYHTFFTCTQQDLGLWLFRVRKDGTIEGPMCLCKEG